jgi:hypothetical protein
MRTATNLGVNAAILLLTPLLCSALDVISGGMAPIKYLGTVCAIVGLLLVITAAVYVIRENTLISRQMPDSEIADLYGVMDSARGKVISRQGRARLAGALVELMRRSPLMLRR